MEIYVLEQESLDRIGMVDIYESFIWTTEFNAVGSFELRCSLDYFDLLQAERLIQNSEDENHAGLIEFITKTEDEEGAESLIVKGRMIEVLLSRRIALGDYAYDSMQPAQIVSDLVDKNVISVSEEARRMNLEIDTLPDAPTGVTSYGGANGSLEQEVFNICRENNLGIYLRADDEQKKYKLTMYTGENRTEEDNTVSEIQTVSISNMLQNGELLSGFTGWNRSGSGLSIKGSGQIGSLLEKKKIWDKYEDEPGKWVRYPLGTGYVEQSVNVDKDHLYYLLVRTNNPTDSTIGFGIKEGSTCTFMSQKENKYKTYNALYVPTASGKKSFALGYGDLSDEPSKEGEYLLIDYGFMLDLTATFGIGKEPTLDWCNKNIYYDSGWKYKREIISFVPNGNDPLVFSRDRDTLISVEYSKDITNECTHVYISGAEDIQTQLSMGNLQGLKRKEIFLDLSKIPKEVDGVELPLPSYLAILTSNAQATIRNLVVNELVYGRFYLLSNKQFRKDFYLGDIVSCVDDKIGFSVNLRITGVTEVWGTEGYSVSITFGDEIPNIYETIKLVSKGAK